MGSMTDLTNVWIHEIVKVATNYIKKWHLFCTKKGIIYKRDLSLVLLQRKKKAGRLYLISSDTSDQETEKMRKSYGGEKGRFAIHHPVPR